MKDGALPESLQYFRCGSLSHARWLTTGERLLFLYTRKHNLSGEPARVLKVLTEFFVKVYFVLYFEFKVKHTIVDGPRHIVTSLRVLRSQPQEVINIVSPYIQSGAWFSHPENILLSLLASSDKKERIFAVEKVIAARGDSEFGDKSVRPWRKPKLNFAAKTLCELIDWEAEQIHEPVNTADLSQAQIVSLKEKALAVPPFSCHTQGTERAVKLTTEAAAAVCGQEAREGYVQARLSHRQSLPSYKCKKDFLKTYN